MLQKIVEFKDFSRLLSDFLVLFKADLIFKDFSRKPSKFKYVSSLCEPCYTTNVGLHDISRYFYSFPRTVAFHVQPAVEHQNIW